MQSGIPIGTNPLLETVMFGNNSQDMTDEMQEYRERQKEAELRLLGTMLFQSVLLAFCILLYVNWSWSHFDNSYESAIFYGLLVSPYKQRFTLSIVQSLKTLVTTADN